MDQVVTANDEAIEAWDGPLYDRFVQFRHLLAGGLGVHGDEGLRVLAPAPGERALDIGCGFGDTTQQLAELVGPEGSALGVDAAPRFIATAREEAVQAGVRNARFAVADVEAQPFEEQFELAFSRMGTMFFANPVAALRNVRKALVPGGRLAMVVWRSKVENEGFYRSQLITERFVTKPEEYDEPTCGPGPFSMGNADTTSGILVSAGFQDISLLRCDKPILIGVDLDEAVEFVMSIGPAGEILRLAGERAAHLHEPVAAALREDMAAWVGPDGTVRGPASTWIVTAQAPAAQS
ncbi:MAG TPA: class I SAM-dependent methyltransferase [Solirubrobacteraceae bacterium]|jgi:SAM-dependent methyltransferase|nr:class I SAM-dependent methyltransferase [Solirubrobacteraceae bacterium]